MFGDAPPRPLRFLSHKNKNKSQYCHREAHPLGEQLLAAGRILNRLLKRLRKIPGPCYVPAMNTSDRKKGSIARPLVKELDDRQKADSKVENPSVGSKPLPAPDLYQDSGGGYNQDFTFPQE